MNYLYLNSAAKCLIVIYILKSKKVQASKILQKKKYKGMFAY